MTKRKTTPQPANNTQVVQVPVADILIPDLRITSQVDDHIMSEMIASIAKDGILQPLQLCRIDGKLYLEDGLHRLLGAKELMFKFVPCIIHDGTEADLMVRNLVLNRQRGKSNPAQELEVIRFLTEHEGKGLKDIVELTGLSEGWAFKLVKVSTLPEEIMPFIAQGQLAISSAYHLCTLEDRDEIVQLAKDASLWRYTEEQIKLRIKDLQGLRQDIRPGDLKFDEAGKPNIIPLTCELCLAEIPKEGNYMWICPEDRQLILALYRAYRETLPELEPAAAPAPVQDRRLVLLNGEWIEK